MPVAEVGKEYTYNGKRYVARRPSKWRTCNECDFFKNGNCVQPMRDGVAHTCIAEKEKDDVIFEEVEDVKETKYMDKVVQLIYIGTLQYMIETETLSPGVIIEEITKAMEYLDVFFLNLMASYIRQAVKNNLVDDCWVKEWTECANRLESCIIEKIKKEKGE